MKNRIAHEKLSKSPKISSFSNFLIFRNSRLNLEKVI